MDGDIDNNNNNNNLAVQGIVSEITEPSSPTVLGLDDEVQNPFIGATSDNDAQGNDIPAIIINNNNNNNNNIESNSISPTQLLAANTDGAITNGIIRKRKKEEGAHQIRALVKIQVKIAPGKHSTFC